jgi:hypothetical protein
MELSITYGPYFACTLDQLEERTGFSRYHILKICKTEALDGLPVLTHIYPFPNNRAKGKKRTGPILIVEDERYDQVMEYIEAIKPDKPNIRTMAVVASFGLEDLVDDGSKPKPVGRKKQDKRWFEA